MSFSCLLFFPITYVFRGLRGAFCCITCMGLVFVQHRPAVRVTDRCENAAPVIFKYSAGEQYHTISGSHWYYSLISGCLNLLCEVLLYLSDEKLVMKVFEES